MARLTMLDSVLTGISLKPRLIRILRHWLMVLEGSGAGEGRDREPSAADEGIEERSFSTAHRASAVAYKEEPAPTKSLVTPEPSAANPRPLLGREKLREQFHFAHCCGVHGCSYGEDYCPLAVAGGESYLGCGRCAVGSPASKKSVS